LSVVVSFVVVLFVAAYDKGVRNGSRCNDLLKAAYTQADHDVFRKPHPFDLGRAHELYNGLFGQIEDLIKDKRLLIRRSGRRLYSLAREERRNRCA
jgi:hypothetical protein